MASPLSDLDELVLKCRDEKAKNYIKILNKTGIFVLAKYSKQAN